jgi:isopropylmalate/homocitrate/citramalate synthase
MTSPWPKQVVLCDVTPKAIPQMADAHDVMQGIARKPGVELVVLVPNQKGAERALACAPDELNLVMSVTASHSQANLRMSPKQSFETLREVIAQTREKVRLNVSLSCSFGCPFEGHVPSDQVLHWVTRFHALGASGNVCMEDIVHALHREGVETGIDLERLIEVSKGLGELLEHPLSGQVVYARPHSRTYALESAARQAS